MQDDLALLFGHDQPDTPRNQPRGFQGPRGGRRFGFSPKAADDVRQRVLDGETFDDVTPESETGALATKAKLEIAKARKEAALADMAELDFKIKQGEYLPRAAYREATATLLAMLSGLRSLPDQLERKANLSPESLDLVSQTIDEALSQVAEKLALFAGE